MHGYKGPRVRVRLADKSIVESDRFVHALVKFDNTTQLLKFTILPVECPNILGMPFLRTVNPHIDWQHRTVHFAK